MCGSGRVQMHGSQYMAYSAKAALVVNPAPSWSEEHEFYQRNITLIDEPVYPPLPKLNDNGASAFLCSVDGGPPTVCNANFLL
jgi:hypothetical protein